jgi:hypothetical protein
MFTNKKTTLGKLSRKISLALAVLMLFVQVIGGVAAADDNAVQGGVNQTLIGEAIEGAAKQLSGYENLSDWAALALAKAGHAVPNSYSTAAKALVNVNKGVFPRVTDAERLALTLGALGYDPQYYEGYNLIDPIFNHEKMTSQGINGPIYALLVLHSGSYTLPANSKWNQNNLLDVILQRQNADGGWSLAEGGKSSVDVTAMAVTAISAFIHIPEVQSSVDNAVSWLTGVQLENGGFNDSGDNSESVSQVIIALSSLGIDSATFTKSGNALAHLLSFRQADGGFAHMSGLGSNGMATEQALLALLAYDSFSKKTGFTLYQAAKMKVTAEIRIEGPNYAMTSGSASGKTVLDALIGFAAAKGIALGITDTSYGKYVSAIGDISEKLYDGYDGWSYNVHRDGSWQFPMVGMADYELKQGDVVSVYYTDYSTQMVDKVTVEPAQPKEGQPFQVKVEQSTWNWTDNTLLVTPAAGVRVQVGAKAAVTDELGVAAFADGARAGTYSVVVTGYSPSVAPTVVRHTQPITIRSKEVAITLAVEGLDHSIAAGSVEAETALDGLELLLQDNGIQYHVKDTQYGKYVDVIDHLSEGSLGGYDGWGYIVKRGAKWIFPAVGIASFLLEAGDHVVLYYTNYSTDPIQSIELQPAQPKVNEPFSILVRKASWDWTNNMEVVSPAEGVDVEVAGLKATTDSSGKASFTAGLPYGKHRITVTGNRPNDAPSVVKATSDVYLFEDQQQVSAWAASDVQKVMTYGLMHGVSTETIAFDARRSITRAEYVALLLRLIGEQPITNVSGSSYNDVPASAWYAGSIAKAKQLGIIEKNIVHFHPERAISREDLAVMTSKALQLSTDAPAADFSDLAEAKAGSIPYISAVADYGILYGSDGKYMPLAPVSREMAAAVAVRIYEKE